MEYFLLAAVRPSGRWNTQLKADMNIDIASARAD